MPGSALYLPMTAAAVLGSVLSHYEFVLDRVMMLAAVCCLFCLRLGHHRCECPVGYAGDICDQMLWPSCRVSPTDKEMYCGTWLPKSCDCVRECARFICPEGAHSCERHFDQGNAKCFERSPNYTVNVNGVTWNGGSDLPEQDEADIKYYRGALYEKFADGDEISRCVPSANGQMAHQQQQQQQQQHSSREASSTIDVSRTCTQVAATSSIAMSSIIFSSLVQHSQSLSCLLSSDLPLLLL